MSNDFDNPVFRKTRAQSQVTATQPMKEYTVGSDQDIQDYEFESPDTFPDPSPPVEQERRRATPAEVDQMRAARKAKEMNINRPSDLAKKRIEILANIGRLTKDVTLDGIIFSIRTLKGRETREASMAILTSGTQLEAGFESRKQQLARSIYQIDGNDPSIIIGSNTLESRLQFIEDLEEVIITKLFDEFSALKEEAKSKYSIVTEEQAEEVAEDLKK